MPWPFPQCSSQRNDSLVRDRSETYDILVAEVRQKGFPKGPVQRTKLEEEGMIITSLGQANIVLPNTLKR